MNKRAFLQQIATAGAAVASGACAAPLLAQTGRTPGSGAPRAGQGWDLSWVERITGKHRAVFDSPAIEDGIALNNAYVWLEGFHDVYGSPDGEMSAVVVLRHRGVPIAFDDALWAKYDLGKMFDVKDPTTGDPARRNPFRHVLESDTHAGILPAASMDTLQGRGVIFVACSLAANATAGRIAKAVKADEKVVQAEVRAGLIPGIPFAPSGIFAVTRAQEAGCGYVRSA